MNLEHIDYFKSGHRNQAKRLYINSFPKEERFPFWILKSCAKEENVEFNAILEENEVIGIEYIVKYENAAYLMYTAVDEKQRGKGYGSKILEDLIEKYKTIVLMIEKPDNDLEDSKKKRKKFYLKNGFFGTNKFIKDTGVEYEILCTNKDYEITKEYMKKRYTEMTTSPIMEYLIGKIFDVHDINIESGIQLEEPITEGKKLATYKQTIERVNTINTPVKGEDDPEKDFGR